MADSIPPRRPGRVGNTLPLLTLAPGYRPEYHRFYVDMLDRSLRHPDTRSIALTGAYGSGKSSVLRALRGGPWRRRGVVELSLSTLDPQLTPAGSVSNPAEREVSNRIQKEIVKQLLYRLPPQRTPQSRFPRASKPAFGAAVLVAGASAIAVGLLWVVATLVGWQAALEKRLNDVDWSTEFFWGCVTVGAVILALIGWRTLAGRYAVRAGVKAGALTVSLEPTSSSYFDQYLDEIMYFFQVSKAGIVLIEDVDRFSDASVLDTLRALNLLVNNSGQIGRRVVFIYAIRDSVLSHVGAAHKRATEDLNEGEADEGESSLQVDRANRAKYFDVIIPIVPFVTTDNARDLMLDLLGPHVAEEPGQPGISPALIRLVARHVADMRTLRSIRNEFEIHADRLITSASNAMPEISADIVLSLVLVRATSPLTFEKIRLSTSNLDKLARRWIQLVDANIDAKTKQLTSLKTQIDNGAAMGSRAKRAGKALNTLRPAFLSMSRYPVAEVVEFAGPLGDENLSDEDGWARIANGEPLTIALHPGVGRPGNSDQVTVGAELLTKLLQIPINPAAWKAADMADLRDQVQRTEDEISFLRHHTWLQLLDRPDLTVKALPDELVALQKDQQDSVSPPAENGLSFAELVQVYAPSDLVGDLISHGYLPRHFARYASMFYGSAVGLNATEYISRAIEPGEPITEYELDETAVAQLLVEQGALRDDADLFHDPSVYNLDIVAYLLEHRPIAAGRVAEHLAMKWGEAERTFVGRFLQRESDDKPVELVSLMAPSWEEAIRYVTVTVDATPAGRLRLVNAALAAVPAGKRRDLDSDVGLYLSEFHLDLPVLTAPPNRDRADIVMKIMAESGAQIFDLTHLSSTALAAAGKFSVYPITVNNLRALQLQGSIALDVLASEREPAFRHATSNLEAYLKALDEMSPPVMAIDKPASFVPILNAIIEEADAATLARFIEATPTTCRADDLGVVETQAWTALVMLRRTRPTFNNVRRYIAEVGFDDALAGFLVEHAEIDTPETTAAADRIDMAAQVLAATEHVPDVSTRVALVEAIAPGPIPVVKIQPGDGEVVGPLLAAGLLSDEEGTFSPKLLTRWKDLESAIVSSSEFVKFADSTTLPPHHLASALRSRVVNGAVKAALIANLDGQLGGATAADATAVAEALASIDVELNLPKLEALRVAGASSSSMIHVLVRQGERLSLADLGTVLVGLGGDYQRVAAGGAGTVRFDVNDDNRALLARLQGVTHTGAKENHTKTYGTKLEASLKQPA